MSPGAGACKPLDRPPEQWSPECSLDFALPSRGHECCVYSQWGRAMLSFVHLTFYVILPHVTEMS